MKSSNNTPEGEKLLQLLKVKVDWQLNRFKEEGWSQHYPCLVHKTSGIRIIPWEGIFSYNWVSVVVNNRSGDAFLNKKDHVSLHPIVMGLIADLRQKENIFINAIRAAKPSISIPTCSDN